jgi:hypothetical protein
MVVQKANVYVCTTIRCMQYYPPTRSAFVRFRTDERVKGRLHFRKVRLYMYVHTLRTPKRTKNRCVVGLICVFDDLKLLGNRRMGVWSSSVVWFSTVLVRDMGRHEVSRRLIVEFTRGYVATICFRIAFCQLKKFVPKKINLNLDRTIYNHH